MTISGGKGILESMKKIKIDKDKCLGCGTCVALSPGVFVLNAEGKAEVKNPTGDSEENIQNVIDSCPVQAISWEE